MRRCFTLLFLSLSFFIPGTLAQAAPAQQEPAASVAVFGVGGAFAPAQEGAFAYVFVTRTTCA